MKKILLITSFLLFSSIGFAQNTIDEIITEFFNKYATDTDDAIDYLFAENYWIQGRKDDIHKIKFQLNETKSLLGQFYGYEKIKEISLGQSQKKLVYAVKYERQPFRFIFVFYKANESWNILNFYFDDDFSEEF